MPAVDGRRGKSRRAAVNRRAGSTRARGTEFGDLDRELESMDSTDVDTIPLGYGDREMGFETGSTRSEGASRPRRVVRVRRRGPELGRKQVDDWLVGQEGESDRDGGVSEQDAGIESPF